MGLCVIAQDHVTVLRVFKRNMVVKLSLDKREWLLKCYWKVENVVEAKLRWRVQFGTPPKRVTITRIRDKFEVLLLRFKSHSIRDR